VRLMTKNMSNIEMKEDFVLVSVNPEVYPLEVIYSAAYVMIDKSYIIIDKNKENKIVVEIRSKKDEDLEELGNLFNEELLNYAVYKTQSEKNSKLRQVIIQRALLTNEFESEEDGGLSDEIDDPEGIAVPWEEKYRKENDKN